jgi:Domain of unknown function (DUF4333)
MSLLVRAGAVVALLSALTFLAAGCGETVIDSAKTEGAIEENLEKSVGQKVSSVECPSGIEVQKRKTFDCTVELQGGKSEMVTLKILNSDADVELTDIKSGSGK